MTYYEINVAKYPDSENHIRKESKQKNVRYGAAAFFMKIILNSTKTFVVVFN
jgi:hypothetical protein